MKTRVPILFLVLACQVLFVSCSTKAKDEPKLDNIELNNINNQVHAKVYELANTLKTVRPVFLEIRSVTPNTIVFKNNFSVRIFQQTNNGWEEIKEEPTTRLPEDDIVFSLDKGTLQIFAVHPHLDDYTHNVQLRIYVIGDMKTDQGTTKVAAYTDVILHP